MAREFLNMHLMSRLKPTLPEMREYYAAHRSDFHRKAQITWREIFVPGQTPESRAKIAALLDRLRRGASFETVAKAESGGPTASKGGKWETGLGASISPAVNSALETLPLKQTSGILEGKKGYHIIRVEHRQAEGPAPFSVVQDKVYNVLFNQNFQREMETYVKKLRSETVITYWINGNAPAPANGERIPEPIRDPQAIRTSATIAP
jgi:peptidyl-prolyl cis-trans isomerase SurA